ncbi:carbon starvation protein A [Hydrogenivirga sp. 128-5-R1-1]|uniref:carbon starvation CstA family protein n=1 Tax=Hydrogenivirga sp. 128-5-R1-1 TaxID=392423 RepID=UPI00015EF93B|nr:carbon starvation protein A [Hydrogenivirga sp. 128-5-R1-1]EDP75292.1 carbon starvation protein A [Hydrogenivirga sp. 128-5-R1-1]
MGAVGIIAFAFFSYLVGYLFYSRYLAERVFALDDSKKTPAHELEDGVDYVPTNRWILLGHHFTSITGAGPIVGPAIAVIWGWLPALLWVVLGAVFIGAVHDFGALVTSVRHKGRSIGSVLGEYAGERARVVFLLLILALAILVNAVFAFVIALLFIKFPSSVIPAWSIIPLALLFGLSVYRLRINFLIPTVFFLLLLYTSIYVGNLYPLDIKPVANALGLEAIMLWIVVLFTYTFFASSLPVWLLLQPRDFLNGLQVVILLFLIYLGAFVANPSVSAPAFNPSPEGAPPIFPFLFITIACGALSGFHALVSSGTTSKQLFRERDARTVGYLGFLGESSLAVAVIIACTAGIAMFSADRFAELYSSWASIKKSAVPAVVEGGANLISSLGINMELSRTLIATLIVLFSATTMDTSVRIQRYILNELGQIYSIKPLKNAWFASLVAVLTSMGLVLAKEGGKGGLLFWPVFGAANQLLAGLALLVTFLYLRREGRPTLPVLLPLVGVLVITSLAMFMNLVNNALKGDYLLAGVSGIILILEVAIILESIHALRSESKGVQA